MNEAMTARPLNAATVSVALIDHSMNSVEEAGANHFERHSQPLSDTETFFVHVADIFTQESRDASAGSATAASQSQTRAQDAITDAAGQARGELERTKHGLTHLIALIDLLVGGRALTLAPRSHRPEAEARSALLASAAFDSSRRNQLAALLQIQRDTITKCTSLVFACLTELRALRHSQQQFQSSLGRLNQFFLVRQRTVATQSTIFVDLNLIRVAPPLTPGVRVPKSRLVLQRAREGTILLEPSAGIADPTEQQREAQRLQRRQRHRTITSTSATTTTATIATAISTDPSRFGDVSMSAVLEAADTSSVSARLHRAQQHFLCGQLFLFLLHEAQQLSQHTNPLFCVSSLDATIRVESPTFPRIELRWQQPVTQLFAVHTDIRLSDATIHALRLRTLDQLLQHQRRHQAEPQQRPIVEELVASGSSDWPRHRCRALLCLIQQCYHQHLVNETRTLLAAMQERDATVAVTEQVSSAHHWHATLTRYGAFLLELQIHRTEISAVVTGSTEPSVEYAVAKILPAAVVQPGRPLALHCPHDARFVSFDSLHALKVELERLSLPSKYRSRLSFVH